jgi:cell division GTPase FtsZ
MQIGVVGVGGGGTALADALLADDAGRAADFFVGAVAVDTDAAGLASPSHIDEDDRHLLGTIHTDREGTAGDTELAAEITREERPELLASVDSLPVGRMDATVVCAALGGGTGAGVAPAVAKLLGQVTGSPVYAVGVLPGVAEVGGDGAAVDATPDSPKRSAVAGSAENADGAAPGYSAGDANTDRPGCRRPDRPLASNAAGAVRALSAASDDLLLADLDVWRASGAPYAAAWSRLNDTVAARLGSLLAAGEAADPTPERVLDAGELTNTFGAGGVSALGSAATAVENGRREGLVGGLLDRLGGADGPAVDEGEAVSVATNTARKAITHRLSLPCDLASASRAAVVFHAPPAWLSRRGLERARNLIEAETGVPEIRWGDHPDPTAEAFRVTVLLAGISASDRLAELGTAVDPA